VQTHAHGALCGEPGSPARRLAAGIATTSLLLAYSGLSIGCGTLFHAGDADTSAIAFTTGELRATEETSLSKVYEACLIAATALGYAEIESIQDADKIRWRATTPGGDPVDIRLKAQGPEHTEVRIRVGVFGNEARSRLVLEQIRQSL
jgi:hypothetical protein